MRAGCLLGRERGEEGRAANGPGSGRGGKRSKPGRLGWCGESWAALGCFGVSSFSGFFFLFSISFLVFKLKSI